MAVGDDVTGWAVGDRACAVVSGGGYAELAIVPAAVALPVPPALDLVSAAAVPEVFTTAFDNLVNRGRLAPGETALIHGGAGGVGTAAIQLAVTRGARVLATAGTSHKVEVCRRLGARAAINYREQDFAAAVAEHTEGRGVDVVLDIVGARYLRANLACLATEGRLVVIGLQGGARAEVDLARLLTRRLSLAGSTLRARPLEAKAALAAQIRSEVIPYIAAGELRPVIDRVLDLDQVVEAHHVMEAGDHVGKIVLRM